MSRPLGVVRSIDSRGCRGWVRLPDVPNYAATVHLVLDDQIHGSALALSACDDDTDQDAHEEGWFVLAVPEAIQDRARDLRVLVGETQSFVDGPLAPPPLQIDASLSLRKVRPSSPLPVATDRDGLALGLEMSDLVDLLYLDILKRSADKTGLAHALAEIASGEMSIQRLRKALLASEEYGRLRLRTRDAPGRVFANPLTVRSSSRRARFETHVGAFCSAATPMPERLLRFFPGLLVRPDVFGRVEAAAAKGLPAREVFCRALAHLSDRPALILPALPPLAEPAVDGGHDGGERDVAVLASSSLFTLGWHDVEDPLGEPFRWMSQIGIILNPHPRRRVERIEVTIKGWYGALGQALAVASERDRLSFDREGAEDGSTVLRISPGGGGDHVAYLVLAGGDAACPYRHTGLPDPRLLCCSVKKALFVYAGEQA